jgi:hypothetical protein
MTKESNNAYINRQPERVFDINQTPNFSELKQKMTEIQVEKRLLEMKLHEGNLTKEELAAYKKRIIELKNKLIEVRMEIKMEARGGKEK